MSWMIVTDSTSDLTKGMQTTEGVLFATVPMRVIVGDKQFVDDANLNVAEMMDAMAASKEGASSACPSPEAWAEEFRKADFSIAVTITGALSGSYNSALVGRDIVLEEFPEKKIHVIDSQSTGGTLELIARKANELIASGLSFDDLVTEIDIFNTNSKLLFTLSSFDNLIKNGRMNRLVGFVAGALKIRAVGWAKDGRLEMLHKVRGGAEKTFTVLVEEMAKLKDPLTYENIVVSHCFNKEGAEMIKKLIEKYYPGFPVEIRETGGLNSFYAERSGLLVAF